MFLKNLHFGFDKQTIYKIKEKTRQRFLEAESIHYWVDIYYLKSLY